MMFNKKRVLTGLLIAALIFCGYAYARVTSLSSLPKDHNGTAASAASLNTVYYMDDATDGSPQEVTITTTQECKSVLIQVHPGAGGYGAGVAFNYATSDGGDYIEVPATGLVRSIGIQGQDSATSNSLGWVTAAAGNKIAVLIMY